MAWDSDGTLSGFDSYEVTLGDQLRGERATKGKSLLDVQRELRIKAAYIAAIENCDLEVFPNRGFVAGYVRSYARYLDLDPDEVYRGFCEQSGFSGVNADIKGRPERGKTAAAIKIDLKNDPLSRGRMGGQSSAPEFDLRGLLGGAASLLVMATLLGGVGYGGWRVLQEVQRVELAPVAQTPDVADQPVRLAALPMEQPGTAGLTAVDRAERDAALERLYRPDPLVPVIAPRDGPIASIDPELVGSFASRVAAESIVESRVENAAAEPSATPDNMDLMTVSAAEILRAVELPPPPPQVTIVAAQPAWIRVSQSDGATLFEKILAAGEAYEVPAGVEAPELRAGNSGAVFLRVGDRLYGPLGDGPRVAKDVSLRAEDIPLQWTVAEPSPDQRAALEGVLIGLGERTASAQP